MATDFLTFLETHWPVIVENKWVFIIYGAFAFILGATISWGVHRYLVDIKLHNIPEREEMQKEISVLKVEIKELKKKIHHQDKELLIREVFRKKEDETIGEVIERNK